MSQPSAFQRFARELRRRHVPQTAAVYLVAAWAAIEFADVVVPNLNGPQWAVTAVIVAALVGFPVVLVLAWVFEWGPEGIHRTGPEETRTTAPAAAAGAEPLTTGQAGPADRRSASPALAAVAVLVVGIGSALAVAAVLAGGDDADPAEGRPAEGEVPDVPRRPEFIAPGHMDSIQRHVERTMGDLEGLQELSRWGVRQGLAAAGLDSLDLDEFVEVATAMAQAAELSVLLRRPREWRLERNVPVTLAQGDTLVVDGVAVDSAGVVAVAVDGATAAEVDQPREALGFTARLVGTGRAGMRRVPVVVRTADGREIRREYRVVQVPRAGG